MKTRIALVFAAALLLVACDRESNGAPQQTLEPEKGAASEKPADHRDFTDHSLLPRSLRPDGIDGITLQNIMNDYCLAFFDRYVRGYQDAWPAGLLGKYEAVQEVDLAYVREWAKAAIEPSPSSAP